MRIIIDRGHVLSPERIAVAKQSALRLYGGLTPEQRSDAAHPFGVLFGALMAVNDELRPNVNPANDQK